MAQNTTHWNIATDATNDEAYEILSQDPIWNCFALADLEPPLRAYSQFALARQDGSGESAICLILRHPIIGQVLSPFGSVEGLEAILKHVAFPEHAQIQVQEMHIPLLQDYYQPETNWRGMWRMSVTPTTFQPQSGPLSQRVKRLTATDLPALKNLYAQHPENTFSADLFAQGIYFGIQEEDRLVAAGGTHVLVSLSHLAVLGNILTASDARGRGFATAVTSVLVAALFDSGYSTVVLNVFEDNSAAVRIYQRLGFRTHRRLLAGRAFLL